MADDAPQVLLQSALEKIVYFEARLGQLQAQLAESREEGTRLRGELSQVAQREMELRRELAGLQVQAERLRAERGELLRVHEASRQERAMLMAKLLEASQIHHAGGEVDFDLASFISTLRGEVLARSAGTSQSATYQAPILGGSSGAATPIPGAATFASERPAFSPGHTEPPGRFEILPTANAEDLGRQVTAHDQRFGGEARMAVSAEDTGRQVTAHAQRLAGEGRLAVSADELRSLSRQDASTPRSEETLLEFSIRELRTADVAARVRAADRLRALGQEAAGPALASALHQEKEPAAQVALLRAFAEVANASGTQVVEPLLVASNPEVRIAALKALLTLDASQAIPHLSAAVKDPDRAVRRRASLLAMGLEPEASLKLGEEALEDPDPEVRGLAALALGAAGGERSRSLLFELVADPQAKVRQAAAQSLTRILGRDVTHVVHLDDAQRRRELRRLASAPVNPVRTALPPTAAALRQIASAAVAPAATAARAPAAPSAPSSHPVRLVPRPMAPVVPLNPPMRTVASSPAQAVAVVASRTATAVLAMAPPPEPDESLCAGIVSELRTALRGRTGAELARALDVEPEIAEDAVSLLCARGQVVRRGLKVYLA